MAINRVSAPNSPPVSSGDWASMLSMVSAIMLSQEMPTRILGANVVKGAVFQIGGTLYLADSDTAVSGTPSEYVKVTPSSDGSVCTAAFVSSLTGVTWNSTYNGWYDTGSPASFYDFDEGKAYTAGKISALKRGRDLSLPLGSGWLTTLKQTLDGSWATALGSALGGGWSTALAGRYGTGVRIASGSAFYPDAAVKIPSDNFSSMQDGNHIASGRAYMKWINGGTLQNPTYGGYDLDLSHAVKNGSTIILYGYDRSAGVYGSITLNEEHSVYGGSCTYSFTILG